MQLADESCRHKSYRIIYSADQGNNFIKLDIENCLVYHANYNLAEHIHTKQINYPVGVCTMITF